MPYEVPEAKKIRLIVNTDAKNEADDQFAIAHALLTPQFRIAGFIAAHFGTGRSATSMEDSFEEIANVLRIMKLEGQAGVYRGAPSALADEETPVPSAGSELIVREALKDDPAPLFVIFLGPLTDLACAYLQEPRIADRLTAVWIGGGAYPEGGEEFNLRNDVKAANVVFRSPIPLWQVPRNVYKMVRVSLAELAVRVRPHGDIGRYLYDQLVAFNRLPTHGPRWPKGETWQLGDSPAVSLLLDDHEFEFDLTDPPHITDELLYAPGPPAARKIRVYRSVDARFTLEDMYAKLELFNREDGCGTN
ncbi:nucleoside hydrolase [Paenibacillus sp. IB182493]|uniref:Nucleoside hydrolase n=2 Tax=Paenibacillus arenilitoris TaxID=2772299 RepID=A0A927CRT5_9BACL|nr:nucleoside hydrolase [Paenibacillus arenilitoris]